MCEYRHQLWSISGKVDGTQYWLIVMMTSFAMITHSVYWYFWEDITVIKTTVVAWNTSHNLSLNYSRDFLQHGAIAERNLEIKSMKIFCLVETWSFTKLSKSFFNLTESDTQIAYLFVLWKTLSSKICHLSAAVQSFCGAGTVLAKSVYYKL